MPSRIDFTETEARQISTLYSVEGASLQAIATTYGTSHPVIKRVLEEQGVAIRNGGPRVLSPSQEKEVPILWAEGWSMVRIAKHFGCSTEPIKRVLSKAGVPWRRKTSRVEGDDLRREIVCAYESDPTVSSLGLAKRFGTHSNEIRRVLLEQGVELRDGRFRRGPANPLYREGRWVGPDGYVRVYVADEDPMSSIRHGRRPYALEHRLVMSNHLGRPLASHERVHHKNGVKGDNRIENLELWSYAHPPGQRTDDKPPHCPTCSCG